VAAEGWPVFPVLVDDRHAADHEPAALGLEPLEQPGVLAFPHPLDRCSIALAETFTDGMRVADRSEGMLEPAGDVVDGQPYGVVSLHAFHPLHLLVPSTQRQHAAVGLG